MARGNERQGYIPRFEPNPLIIRAAATLDRDGANHIMFVTRDLYEISVRSQDLNLLLECLEAASAREIYQLDTNLCARIIRNALAKIILLGEAGMVSPETLAELIVNRTFWGTDGQVYGRPDYGPIRGFRGFYEEYNRHYRGTYTSMMRQIVRWPALTPIENRSRIKKYLDDPTHSRLSYGARVYIHTYLLLGRPVEFTLTLLKNVTIGNADELEFAIEGLETIAEGAIPVSRGLPLVEQSMQMISTLIMHCAVAQQIPNAIRVQEILDQHYTKTRSPLQLTALIDLARGLRAQMTGAQTVPGELLDSMVPEAVETIMEVILYLGQNRLEPAHRELLMSYARLACDVFVLGRYVQAATTRSELTVGDFLERNPDLSAERLNDVLNPEYRARFVGSAANFRRRFSSSVSWQFWRAGYGRMS